MLAACHDGSTDKDEGTDTVETDEPAETDMPGADGTYTFMSRFDSAASSVSYSGQTARHVLIIDMKSFLTGLTDDLNTGAFSPSAGDVTAALEFYFDAPDETLPHGVSTTPAALQTRYEDISSGKNLVDKLAGNDTVTDHKDWTTALIGWPTKGVYTPETLVRAWFSQLDTQSVDWVAGTYPTDPSGAPVDQVFLTSRGLDLQQLLQKFLTGAIAFSQGADDYLDDDIEGKGLLADHSEPVEGKTYTALEHAWDEGFGYFGAARDYLAWTDDQIADDTYMDSYTPDGAIDLTAEYNFGHAINAAKRDRDAQVATDFTTEAFQAFHDGRSLLATTDGALTDDELDLLRGYRDTALAAWEEAIAATVVHYINDVLQDMATFNTPDYDFGTHAKHWSEAKGFALSFQFNPHSPMTDEQFVELHRLLRQAPVLPGQGGGTPYKDDLRAARALLGTVYNFDPDNLGDDDGLNGW
jgi:hypothetical protein